MILSCTHPLYLGTCQLGHHQITMKKPSKFASSSFHKEGRNTQPVPQKAKVVDPNAPLEEFFSELVETGKPNWKKAPAAVKTRYNGIFLVLFSIPLILLPGWELYRRLGGKSTKKVQQGEILEGKQVRKFDEVEKWQTEKDSLLYKIFGKDFFLDGFTSKTMRTNESKELGSKDQ